MNYIEEQKGEIEALESIYYGDLEIFSTEPYYKFSIPIKSEEYEPETDNGLSCTLQFTYTANYPDEPPLVEILNSENLTEDDKIELNNHILNQAQENIGIVMIFTLVSSSQEFLNVKWEKIKKHRDDTLAKKLLEEEEAERKRFEGTRVTVETFLKWKVQFEEEMGITKRKEIADKESKKLTGRELFMTDKTLNESDLKFLEDGSDGVKVDESLFQDLEDLDFEDDDDDDYEPSDCSNDST